MVYSQELLKLLKSQEKADRFIYHTLKHLVMHNKWKITLLIVIASLMACQPPAPVKKGLSVKHNYIILLDLSDRLIVQNDQPARDKEIIRSVYKMFELRVKSNLYIRSRDEIKVVIAPQRGSKLQTDIYENQLYVNMENIPTVYRKAKETERRDTFNLALDELYKRAVYSKVPKEYYGADIWKYFYEDLKDDCSNDTLTQNYLFILTDGYPIVGKNPNKLQPVNKNYPNIEIILVEGSPRDKDLEWDHIREMWASWFDSMNIKSYKFIKRKALTKEIESIQAIISN